MVVDFNGDGKIEKGFVWSCRYISSITNSESRDSVNLGSVA
jgi:hypothetical protein